MMLPNFLGIGAQKAGTTWLHDNLSNHEDLWLPPIKEIHYFDYKEKDFTPTLKGYLFANNAENRRWRRIIKNRLKTNFKKFDYRHFKWDINYLFCRQNNDEWYSSLFEQGKGKIVGEITPAYSSLSDASVEYVHTIMPDIKIIFMMRNPIERAWSYFFSYITKYGKTIDSFSEAELKQHFSSDYSLRRGKYSQTIKIWQKYYSSEQFCIVFFEEIVDCPENLLAKICSFLGTHASSNYLDNINKNKVNYFGNQGNIPKRIAQYLADIYYDEIYYLNQKYNGYTNNWLDYAEKNKS